jgi:hypothetical protein
LSHSLVISLFLYLIISIFHGFFTSSLCLPVYLLHDLNNFLFSTSVISLSHCLCALVSRYLSALLSPNLSVRLLCLTIQLYFWITVSLPRFRSTSPSPKSLNLCLTTALSMLPLGLTVSLPVYVTISVSPCLSISLSHCLTASLPHCLTYSAAFILTTWLRRISLTRGLAAPTVSSMLEELSSTLFYCISLLSLFNISGSHCLTVSLSPTVFLPPTVSLSRYLPLSFCLSLSQCLSLRMKRPCICIHVHPHAS